VSVAVGGFVDSFVPYDDPGGAKRFVRKSMPEATPDVVFAPQRTDLHQDHRFLADVAGQVCRDSVILGYEIAKYDGGLEPPSLYVHLSAHEAHAKVEHLRNAFPSQVKHHWYSQDAFLSLMRLRGIESNAPEGYAEAFIAPKLVLA
jgi:LmbE family N-acetylglucosaminyl deacetylase